MQDFYLFETMLVSNFNIFLLNYHLNRMLNSAKILKFETFILESNIAKLDSKFMQCNIVSQDSLDNLNLEKLQNIESLWFNIFDFMQLFKINITLDSKDYILRLILYKNGVLKYEISPINKIINNDIFISKNKQNHNNIFLYHKTSIRDMFADSLHFIKQNHCFDFIYFNKKNELTQGGRSNIILEFEVMESKNKFKSVYFTPSQSSGLLKGTMLKFLLDSNLCKEKILYKNDLLNAKNIYCCNALRGILRVELKG